MSIKGWIKKEVLRLDRQVDRWQIDRGADRCNGKKNLCIYTYIYTYMMEYYLAIKKKEILLFAITWMELEEVMLGEISQRQMLYNVTYVWNLKKEEKLIEKD